MAISSNGPQITDSIVIVSYRTGPVLFDCLSACLSQSDQAEIILVDNGNPPEVLAELQALAAREPRLRIITGHGNIGFAAAVNKGAAQANGDHLWILNPDAIPHPGTLTALQQAAAQATAPYLIGVAIRNPDGSEQRGSRREILTPRLALVEALKLHKLGLARFNHHQDVVPTGLTEVPAISGASMYLHRKDFDAIGGMDEKYFLHVEDLDLCLRFGQAGGHVYYAAHIDLPHQGGTSDAPSLTVEWHKARSFIYYFRKNFMASHGRLMVGLVSCAVLGRFAIIAGDITGQSLRQKAARRHAK